MATLAKLDDHGERPGLNSRAADMVCAARMGLAPPGGMRPARPEAQRGASLPAAQQPRRSSTAPAERTNATGQRGW